MAHPVLETYSEGTGSSGSSQTLSLPTGVASGDFLVMVLSNDVPGSISSISGWTQASLDAASAYMEGAIYTKVAGSSESDPIVNYSPNSKSAYKIFRISASNNAVIESAAVETGSGSNTVNFNSISPSADALLLKVGCWDQTVSVSAGPTTGTIVGSTQTSSSSITAYQQNVSLGATAADSLDLSGNVRNVGYVIAIEEGAGGGGSASLLLSNSNQGGF